MKILASILTLLLTFSSAVCAEEILTRLKNKGLKEGILKNLNGACLRAVDFDFKKDHSFWQSVWNKNGGFLVLDFLQGTKHYTLTVRPVGKEKCITSRTIVAYWTNPCPKLRDRYKNAFPENAIKIRETQDIFIWMSNGRGTDIYLYKTPGGCVEIFREIYTMKD